MRWKRFTNICFTTWTSETWYAITHCSVCSIHTSSSILTSDRWTIVWKKSRNYYIETTSLVNKDTVHVQYKFSFWDPGKFSKYLDPKRCQYWLGQRTSSSDSFSKQIVVRLNLQAPVSKLWFIFQKCALNKIKAN